MPGLLKPFLLQICMSVERWGRIQGARLFRVGPWFWDWRRRCVSYNQKLFITFCFEATHKNSILLTFVNNALP